MQSLPSSVFVNLQARFSVLVGHGGQRHSPSSSSFPLRVCGFQQSCYPKSIFPSAENQGVAAVVFGDGSESQLYPLTNRRSEGAIPMGGNYRLVDAVVSNCINSSINKIYALTQFNSASLNSHLSNAYNGIGFGTDCYMEVIAAYQSLEDQRWFQGTADALRRCLWILEEHPASEFLILPGYHLYKMDYQELIQVHRSSQADVTVAALSYISDRNPGRCLYKLDQENKVVEFHLKSEKGTTAVSSASKFHHHSNGSAEQVMQAPDCGETNNATGRYFSSMGIYLVNRDTLKELLLHQFPEANNFDEQVIPGAISDGMKVQASLFDGCWEDLRSVADFYQTSMDCIKRSSMAYNFYDRESTLYTVPRVLPPTTISGALIVDSLIGDGCIINNCKIQGTVVGVRTRIGDGAIIEDSVIVGSDIYQEDARINGGVPVGIGSGAQIRKAIIDKNARIGRNALIINRDKVQEGNKEASGYVIRGGIVVVLQDAIIPPATIL